MVAGILLKPENVRRAKIKLLHKKSIETGEECDAIPDSMRQYLINQAMEAGKPFPREFLGQSADMMNPYGGGGGFLGAEAANPAKVGKCTVHLIRNERVSRFSSDTPFPLQVAEHRLLASRWPERDGSRHLLRSGESVLDLLHQQRLGRIQDRVPFLLHQEHHP